MELGVRLSRGGGVRGQVIQRGRVELGVRLSRGGGVSGQVIQRGWS